MWCVGVWVCGKGLVVSLVGGERGGSRWPDGMGDILPEGVERRPRFCDWPLRCWLAGRPGLEANRSSVGGPVLRRPGVAKCRVLYSGLGVHEYFTAFVRGYLWSHGLFVHRGERDRNSSWAWKDALICKLKRLHYCKVISPSPAMVHPTKSSALGLSRPFSHSGGQRPDVQPSPWAVSHRKLP